MDPRRAPARDSQAVEDFHPPGDLEVQQNLKIAETKLKESTEKVKQQENDIEQLKSELR